jgi:hypothetical protein
MSRWFDKDVFYAQLEEDGEEKVRDNLLSKRYGDVSNKKAFAEEWLAQRERARNEASQSEQIEIARSAKDAAWEAAAAAREAAAAARLAADEAREQSRIARAANTRATIALIIATLGVIASIIIPLISRPS